MATQNQAKKENPITAVVNTLVERCRSTNITPWTNPVYTTGSTKPRSIATLNDYKGINSVSLMCPPVGDTSPLVGGSYSTMYGTFKQFQELGLVLRKGSEGTGVVYANRYETDPETDGGEKNSYFFWKRYVVFSLNQCTDESLEKTMKKVATKVGIPLEHTDTEPEADAETIKKIEAAVVSIAKRNGITVSVGLTDTLSVKADAMVLPSVLSDTSLHGSVVFQSLANIALCVVRRQDLKGVTGDTSAEYITSLLTARMLMSKYELPQSGLASLNNKAYVHNALKMVGEQPELFRRCATRSFDLLSVMEK